MSTDYTKNDINNIYFLNDRNIATTLSDEIAKNAIPSHELFKEKYNELTVTDNEISGKLEDLSCFANKISSDLDTKTEKALGDAKTYTNEVSSGISGIIDTNRTSDKNELSNVLSSYTNKQVSDLSTSLSNTVEEKFVNVSGDTITGELKVNKVLATEFSSGDTNISGNVSISGKKVIIGKSSAKYDDMFVWNADENVYEGNSIDQNIGRTFNINPLHGSRGFFIGNNSLSDIIKNNTQLTATDIRKEIDVVSSLMIEKYALSADVKSEIDRIDNTGYLISNDFGFEYKDQKIWLSAGNKVVSIDAGDFIKDGMLSSVNLTTYQVGDELHQGLQFIFNTDQKQDPIYVDLNQLVDVYKGSNGISVDINTYTITPNFEIIAKTSDVKEISGNLSQLSSSVKEISSDYEDRINKNTSQLNTIQEYVNGLSTTNGIIITLSNDLKALDSSNTNIDNRLKTIESETKNIDKNVSNINTKVEINITNIENLEKDSDSTKERIKILEETDKKLVSEGGTIDNIKNDISILYKVIANNATFCEHIEIVLTDNGKSLAEIFETKGLINPGSNPKTLKNGNMYQIYINGITQNSLLSDKAKASFITSDGFKLVHGDYIVIHSHDKDYIELTDLINCIEVIPSVRFDEFNAEILRASLKEDALCAEISHLSNQVSDISSYLSDEIELNDADIKYLSDEISTKWEATCLSANNLCIALSDEIDRAVAYEKYLSDEISLSANNLCIALSDEIEQVTILTNNLTSNYIEKTIIKSAISSLTLDSQLSDVIIALSILNDSL